MVDCSVALRLRVLTGELDTSRHWERSSASARSAAPWPWMSRLARCLRWSRFWCLWTCCWCSSSVLVNGSALGARFAAHHAFSQERRERQCALVESGDTRRSITATRWNEWRWYNIMYFCYPLPNPSLCLVSSHRLWKLVLSGDGGSCADPDLWCSYLSVVTWKSYPPHINMSPPYVDPPLSSMFYIVDYAHGLSLKPWDLRLKKSNDLFLTASSAASGVVFLMWFTVATSTIWQLIAEQRSLLWSKGDICSK